MALPLPARRHAALGAPVLIALLATGSLAAQGADEEDSGVSVGYDNGFFLRSDDGRNELVLEGLFQVLFGGYDDARDPRSDATLKRFRPELAGKFDEWMRFRLEPNFTEDEVELEEAWVGAQLGRALLQFGRMKVPFGLEEVRSRRYIDFPHFSVLNQFSPAEDHGVFLYGTAADGFWEYGTSVTNGTGSSDDNGNKDVAARVMIHPFRERQGSAWQNFQIGTAVTWGRQDESVGDDEIVNALKLPVTRYVDDLALDGTRWRWDLEAAWYHGPWMAQGEVLVMSQEMSDGTSQGDIGTRGAYVTLSRALTGEDKSFAGVDPARPFDPANDQGSGAWVAALRLSQIDLDDDLEDRGFAEPGTFTDRIRGISLGLDWYPNRHAIVRSALIYNDYADTVTLDDGSVSNELGVLVEVQLHF
jgi:phosphate-selective porin